MKIYCMCHERNNKPESQAFMAINLYAPYDSETDFRAVVLQKPMNVKKIGVKQVLLFSHIKKMNDWTSEGQVTGRDIMKEHYPYVNMYECPHCGARICVE